MSSSKTEVAYRKKRDEAWAASGDRCWYCGASGSDVVRTVDHVIPSGSNEAWNLVPACRECNGIKSIYGIETFRAKVARVKAGWPSFTWKQLRWLYANGVLNEPPRYVFYFEKVGLIWNAKLAEKLNSDQAIPEPLPHMVEYYRQFGFCTPIGNHNPTLGRPLPTLKSDLPTTSNHPL